MTTVWPSKARFRIEPAYKAAPWLTLSGSFDARLDNLEQVEREWRLDVRDRGSAAAGALAARRATRRCDEGPLAVDVGKQFIRWGKADILNPTDRFAPRDFLEVTDDEFLAVTGARAQYERGPHSIDVVWVPIVHAEPHAAARRRWAPLPPQTLGATGFLDLGADVSDAFAVRCALERARSGFRGLAVVFRWLQSPAAVHDATAVRSAARRTSAHATRRCAWSAGTPQCRSDGSRSRARAASFLTTSDDADDVVLYVVQLERQAGELSLVGGYAGEIVTEQRSTFDFAPDRGLTRAFLGRASYTIGANRAMCRSKRRFVRISMACG